MKTFIYDLLDKLNMGIVVIDDAFRVVYVNRWIASKMSVLSDSIISHSLEALSDKFALPAYRKVVEQVFETGRGRFLSGAIHQSFFVGADDLAGDSIRQNLQLERLNYQGKRVVMIQVTDVTAHNYKVKQMRHFIKKLEVENSSIKQSEVQSRIMALHDALTQIPNRTFFLERLKETVALADEKASAFGLFFIDMDHLKPINDTYGHQVGDDVIKTFAERLKESIRSSDFVARLSGDEFAIIMTHESSRAHLEMVARRILESVRAPIRAGGHTIYLTCSIGIALYCGEDVSEEALIDKADRALYQVKRNGRNGYKFYTQNL